MKAFLRVRPALNGEDLKGVEVVPPDQAILRNGIVGRDGWSKQFVFDGVFGPQQTQRGLYDAVASDCVQSIFDGHHSLIMAYGPTGSGKTYTISGKPEGGEGIVLRAVNNIFSAITNDSQNTYTCEFQAVQIYNEMICDLLNTAQNQRIEVRKNINTGVMNLDGAMKFSISNAAECIAYIQEVEERKVVYNTRLNQNSSRSHVVYIITVIRDIDGQEGRLTIVDLAGSERISRSGNNGQRATEAKYINNSLLVLGRVVNALADPTQKSHIPFRESKLTRMLQYSLAGNGKTVMIINVSGCQALIDETEGAINFGQRAMHVKQRPKVHNIMDPFAELVMLQGRSDHIVMQMRERYQATISCQQDLMESITQSEIMVLELQTVVQNLELKKKDLTSTIKMEKREVVKLEGKLRWLRMKSDELVKYMARKFSADQNSILTSTSSTSETHETRRRSVLGKRSMENNVNEEHTSHNAPKKQKVDEERKDCSFHRPSLSNWLGDWFPWAKSGEKK